MKGWKTDWASASASDRPERGDAGSGLGESERDSSLTSVDLQVRELREKARKREREKIKKMERNEKI